MPLTETQILQKQINSFEPELALLGCVTRRKWSPPIVKHSLAVLDYEKASRCPVA